MKVAVMPAFCEPFATMSATLITEIDSRSTPYADLMSGNEHDAEIFNLAQAGSGDCGTDFPFSPTRLRFGVCAQAIQRDWLRVEDRPSARETIVSRNRATWVPRS